MTHRKLIEQLVAALEYPHNPQGWYAKTCKEHEAITAAREYLAAPEQSEPQLTGCACRWDAEDNRVATCERHQGWLDVVHEWAERAKAAEQAPQPTTPEPVNQMLLAALQRMIGKAYKQNWNDNYPEELEQAEAAIAAAEQAQQPTELTDEEIEGLVVWRRVAECEEHFDRIEFARAVLAAQKGNQRD